MAVEIIRLFASLPDAYLESLRRERLTADHYRTLISGRPVNVHKPDGSLLLAFRPKVLSLEACERAYPALLRAAVPSHNRGDAAGGRMRVRKRDGTLSNTHASPEVLSGIIGHFADRPGAGNRGRGRSICRATQYTATDVAGWYDILPFIHEINDVFASEVPDRYAAQREAIRQTPPRHVIPGPKGDLTAFTTVTVNRNFPTYVHKDAGDLKEGFGVMSVIQAGEYGGCFLVFPKFQIAVDMRSQDVLLADVHEFHGNTEIIGVEGKYERLCIVLYYRTKMRFCDAALS
jgi:hypothetical protein